MELLNMEDAMQQEHGRRSFGEIRRRAFLTVRDLAEKADVSSRTIMDLEHGRTYPQLRTIRKLSTALDVDPLDVEEFALVIEGNTKKAAA